ncbi:MAG: hypothetical protein GY862_07705 [Gammaproteobacteria bacterium]|nr:hypothetical protein [Gammaproteobacteria bacterium]
MLLISNLALAQKLNVKRRPTPDEYWHQVRKVAADYFRGYSIELDLDTGYTHQIERGTEDRGNAVSVGLNWPIYSTVEKERRRSGAIKFQRDAAQLISELEESINIKRISLAELPSLEARKNADGLDGFTKYMSVVKEIAKHDARITATHRKLQALIKPFADKIVITSNRDMKVTE